MRKYGRVATATHLSIPKFPDRYNAGYINLMASYLSLNRQSEKLRTLKYSFMLHYVLKDCSSISS